MRVCLEGGGGAIVLQERTVVGHALANDFEVLRFQHPPELVRDTARYGALSLTVAQCGHVSEGQEHTLVIIGAHAVGLFQFQ